MRKEVRARSLVRREPKREPYDKVLIVCEGKKTEPNYLKGIKDALRLNSANVKVIGEGATPTSIVRSAKKRYRKEKSIGDPFDKVFCVFDKDQHTDYNAAVEKIKGMKPKRPFIAITSVPAFEYWLLLHYEYSTQPCNSSEVLSRLKHYMPNYKKGEKYIFTQLQKQLEDAKRNAQRSLDSALETGTDNPSTRVHKLVKFLQKLKRK